MGGAVLPLCLLFGLRWFHPGVYRLYGKATGNLQKGLRSDHRTEKSQFSFQSQWRAMPNNVQTTEHLHSFCILVMLCSKSFKLGFSSMWTKNFQMYKLGLEKAEEPEIKLPTSIGSERKQRNSRKTFSSASLTTLKPLTVWITTNCGKLLKRWEYQTILPVSWETCMQVKKQQLDPCMEQLIGSRLRKERLSAVTLIV